MRGISRALSAVVGSTLAALFFVASASAQTATIGSTSGTPTDNICNSTCTYISFNNPSTPTLKVPFNGTVTSFSLNEGSAGNQVQLRVLRPASGGQFTAIASGPTHTTNATLETVPVSLPVCAGDVLALDVSMGGIVFDRTSPTAFTSYYEPPLADGSTGAPNQTQQMRRLLMSAVVQGSSNPSCPKAPTISNAHLTHKRFRIAKGKTPIAAKAPRGTAFKFTLSTAASVQIVIAKLVSGRRKGGRCVKSTAKLRKAHAKKCQRQKQVGTLTRANLPRGANTVKFTGRLGNKKLKPAHYLATLTATNSVGSSAPVALRFKVVHK